MTSSSFGSDDESSNDEQVRVQLGYTILHLLVYVSTYSTSGKL